MIQNTTATPASRASLRPVFLSLAFAHLQPSSASPILSTLSDETRPS